MAPFTTDPAAHPGMALAELRRATGVSQAQLAARLGTTQSAVARLEGGRLSPSVRTLENAYAALGQRLLLVPRPVRPLYSGQPRAEQSTVREPTGPYYQAREPNVDVGQLISARRLTPSERLDHLAAAVRGVDDLLRTVRR